MSQINEGMFTSDREDWATPQSFFDLVDAEFHFTLDAAADGRNAKCARYYTTKDDALQMPWVRALWQGRTCVMCSGSGRDRASVMGASIGMFDFVDGYAESPSPCRACLGHGREPEDVNGPSPEVVWCNPPYGRAIGKWVEKGYREAQAGAIVVMLIPSRTDTSYWHDFVMKAAELRLIRGRLVFGSGEALSNAPFPSALVVFRQGVHIPIVTSMDRGGLQRRAAA